MLDTLPAEKWTTPVRTSPRNSVPFILAWWLADGKRTIGEIETLLQVEINRYRECIPAWFTFLEKHGYVYFGDEEPEEIIAEPDKEITMEVTDKEPESFTPEQKMPQQKHPKKIMRFRQKAQQKSWRRTSKRVVQHRRGYRK
jgi:hypothetical protein